MIALGFAFLVLSFLSICAFGVSGRWPSKATAAALGFGMFLGLALLTIGTAALLWAQAP